MEKMKRYFKKNKIGIGDISKAVGYGPHYVSNLLSGYVPLNEKAKLRFARAYPDLAPDLFPEFHLNDNGNDKPSS